jgi:cytochrome c oxidase subunit II
LPEVGDPNPADKKPAHRTARLAAVAGMLGGALLVAGCIGAPEGGIPGFFAPPSAAGQGQEVDQLYYYVFLIAVAVFVLVEGLLLWIVLRYRRRPTAEGLPPQTHGNNLLEILWTLIPAAVVTMLFVATVQTLASVESLEAEPQGVVVDVHGFQWQWTFSYEQYDPPLTFTGAGEVGPVMVVPVDETVRIRLHADDVIHSFYVPMFRYKQDVVPGRVNQFDIRIDEPGTYAGQCAEFCGLLHYAMHFTVQAVPRAEFDAWVTEQQQAPQPSPPPDGEGHTIQLATPNENTFIPDSLTAPADTPIVFELDNTDPALPHNVAIVDGEGAGSDWVGQPFANAGEQVTYAAPALAAGEYEFYCSVHPLTMRGTLTVGP